MITTNYNFPDSSYNYMYHTDSYPSWFKNEKYYLCDNFMEMLHGTRKRKKNKS